MALVVILTVFVKESLTTDHQKKSLSVTDTSVWAAGRLMCRSKSTMALSANFFLQVTCKFGVFSAFVLYVRHMWSWSPAEVSYFLATDALTKSLSVLVTVPLINKFIPLHSFWRRDSTWIIVWLWYGQYKLPRVIIRCHFILLLNRLVWSLVVSAFCMFQLFVLLLLCGLAAVSMYMYIFWCNKNLIASCCRKFDLEQFWDRSVVWLFPLCEPPFPNIPLRLSKA